MTKSATEAAAQDDAKNAIDALGGLPLLFSSHASALPERASWLTAKRKEVSGLVATVVNHSLEEQDWTEAQQQVKDLTTLMGTAWATSTVAKIDKLESAAQARADAEERRQARAQDCIDDRCRSLGGCADEYSTNVYGEIVSITDHCRWMLACNQSDVVAGMRCLAKAHDRCITGCGGVP